MRLLILLMLTLPLNSCGALKMDAEQLICLFCVHTKVKSEKKPADEAGLNSKSTQDFSDPEKDQAPKRDAQKDKRVRP